jgi:ribosome biogenesis GTPase
MTALVVSGSKNIFIVQDLSTENGRKRYVECRIKGKVLKGVEGFYNPLAPGDRVEVEEDPTTPGKGRIVALGERKNSFIRFNQKGQSPQLLAANVDLVLCVASPGSPPFRPRFLDRLLVQAEYSGIRGVIVLNKNDLEDDLDVDERLEDFVRIGYPVFRVSAQTGEGLTALKTLVGGKFSVMVGQSGVGKSSLLNALTGNPDLRVGDLSEKYDRGTHTTTMATLVPVPTPEGFGWVIDTPGIRRLVPHGMGADDLALYFREFAPLVGLCTFGLSCTHQTEPGCKIMEAVDAGVIHEDRYESFLRLRDELAEGAP